MIATRKPIAAVAILALISFLVSFAMTRFNEAGLLEARKELRALQETEAQLLMRAAEKSTGAVPKGKLPVEAIWAFPENGQAEAELQKALERAANEAGLNVLSFGASAVPTDIKVPAIAYEIELEGGHSELTQFIARLEAQEPRVAISYLWVRQMPGMDEAFISPVSLRLSVWGFLPSEADPQ
jgi:hypothetical protein